MSKAAIKPKVEFWKFRTSGTFEKTKRNSHRLPQAGETDPMHAAGIVALNKCEETLGPCWDCANYQSCLTIFEHLGDYERSIRPTSPSELLIFLCRLTALVATMIDGGKK